MKTLKKFKLPQRSANYRQIDIISILITDFFVPVSTAYILYLGGHCLAKLRVRIVLSPVLSPVLDSILGLSFASTYIWFLFHVGFVSSNVVSGDSTQTRRSTGAFQQVLHNQQSTINNQQSTISYQKNLLLSILALYCDKRRRLAYQRKCHWKLISIVVGRAMLQDPR